MYIHALSDTTYEENMHNWEQNKRKGPKPSIPEGYWERSQDVVAENRDKTGRPIAPDIGDMFDDAEG
jgi:hypothetical protein